MITLLLQSKQMQVFLSKNKIWILKSNNHKGIRRIKNKIVKIKIINMQYDLSILSLAQDLDQKEIKKIKINILIVSSINTENPLTNSVSNAGLNQYKNIIRTRATNIPGMRHNMMLVKCMR